MSKLLKFTILFAIIILGHDRISGQISGVVIDNEDKPLEGVAIALLQIPDSIYISGTMTDSLGKFVFTGSTVPKKAILRADGIGYKKADITVVQGTPCEIKLETSELALDEVTVTPPSLQVSPGKFTFYPGDITSYVNDGFSILEYAPLLQISKTNDSVDIIGKKFTAIFINGKEPIGGDYAAIKLLQAAEPSRIKRVEIIMQPKISDSEYESIVNVIMTPQTGNLVTADVFLHAINDRLSSRQQVFYYGEYDRWQFSASLHANESRSKRNSHSSYTTYGTDAGQPDLIRTSDSEELTDNNWLALSLGSNLDLAHNNSIGVNLDLNLYETKINFTQTSDYQPEGITQETISQTDKPYKPFGSVTLKYDHELDTLGSSLWAKASFYFREQEESTSYNPDSHLSAYRMPLSKNSFQLKAGWNKIFNDNLSLQVGAKGYHDRQHYKMSESTNTNLSPDMVLTDNFRYLQSQADIFASVDYNPSTTVGFRIGATGRWYERTIDQYIQEIHRTYSDFYLLPTVSMSLSFNPNHLLTVAYGNTLRQPDYTSVNPIVKWNSPTSYTQGNPDLKAETSHDITLTYILLQRIVLGGNSSFKNNIVRWVSQPVGNGVTAGGPVEIGKAAQTNLFVSYQNAFFQYRWALMGQIGWSYNHYSEWKTQA